MIEFVNKKTIAVDDTLTKKGWAADAEAVGKALAAGGTVGGATEAYVDAAIEDVKNYIDEAIENIDIPEGGGGADVDLSDYYTKEETNQMIAASNTSAQSYVDSKTKFDNASLVHNEAGALTVSYGGAVIKTQAANFQPEEGQLPTSNPQWNITLKMPGVPVGEAAYVMGMIGGTWREYQDVWIYGAGESGNQDEVSDLISWISTDGESVTISPGSAFEYNVTQIETFMINTKDGTTYIPIDGGVIPVDGSTIINDGGILSATLNEARVSELIWEALDSIPNAEEGEY